MFPKSGAGADQAVRRDAAPGRRVRPVRGLLETGVRDVRQARPDRQDVGPPTVHAAVDAVVRRALAGRDAAPVRAVRGRGAREPRAVLRRVRGRAAGAPRVRRGRQPDDPVQHVRARVRRHRRPAHCRVQRGDGRQDVHGVRSRGHGELPARTDGEADGFVPSALGQHRY